MKKTPIKFKSAAGHWTKTMPKKKAAVRRATARPAADDSVISVHDLARIPAKSATKVSVTIHQGGRGQPLPYHLNEE